MQAARFWCPVLLAGFTACATFDPPPTPATASSLKALKNTYAYAATRQGPSRNPTILIPGVLGSRLVHGPTGRYLWGKFGKNTVSPHSLEGQLLLSLPMTEQVSGAGDVIVDGIIDRVEVNILGHQIGQTVYHEILEYLRLGTIPESSMPSTKTSSSVYEFPYDWRLDTAQNAQLLHHFIEKTAKVIEAEDTQNGVRRRYPVMFDIVAHSMGAMITNYYLRYGDQQLQNNGPLPTITWEGARRIQKVILVAPTNAGSVTTFMDLIQGKEIHPVLPRYPAVVIGTYPSAYQLLPRPRHGSYWLQNSTPQQIQSIYDFSIWERFRWGLFHEKNDDFLKAKWPHLHTRRERVTALRSYMSHMLKRAERMSHALDQYPSWWPSHIQYHLMAGDSEPTPFSILINSSGAVSVNQWAPGDGTILRTSSLLDERVGRPWVPKLRTPIPWRSVQFYAQNHLELTKSPDFANNLLYWLLESP